MENQGMGRLSGAIYFGLLAALFGSMTLLPADGASVTLTGSQFLNINLPEGFASASSTSPSVSLSGITTGGYTMSGEVCLDGWCTGQAQVPNTVNAPLTLLFTNVSVDCAAGGPGCAEVFLSSGNLLQVESAQTGLLPVAWSFTGSYSGSEPLTGRLSPFFEQILPDFFFTIPSGDFSFSSPAALIQTDSDISLGFSIRLDGMPAGASLTLPDSLSIVAGPPVPEPASVALFAGSLLALAIFRRRTRQ